MSPSLLPIADPKASLRAIVLRELHKRRLKVFKDKKQICKDGEHKVL